jgi:hypothetical protein
MTRLLILLLCSGGVAAQITSVPPASNPNAPDIPRRQIQESRRVIIKSNPPVKFDPLRKRSPLVDQFLGLPRGWQPDAAPWLWDMEEPLQPIEPIRPVEPFARFLPFEPIEPVTPIEPIQPIEPVKPLS